MGSWQYGTYDVRINGFTGGATYFYDGTIAGTQQAYVYYTVKNANGNEVKDLANAKVGEYTLSVTVAETDNYTGLHTTLAFTIGENAPALTGGEIAGITIASVAVAGLAAAVIVLLIKRRKTA